MEEMDIVTCPYVYEEKESSLLSDLEMSQKIQTLELQIIELKVKNLAQEYELKNNEKELSEKMSDLLNVQLERDALKQSLGIAEIEKSSIALKFAEKEKILMLFGSMLKEKALKSIKQLRYLKTVEEQLKVNFVANGEINEHDLRDTEDRGTDACHITCNLHKPAIPSKSSFFAKSELPAAYNEKRSNLFHQTSYGFEPALETLVTSTKLQRSVTFSDSDLVDSDGKKELSTFVKPVVVNKKVCVEEVTSPPKTVNEEISCSNTNFSVHGVNKNISLSSDESICNGLGISKLPVDYLSSTPCITQYASSKASTLIGTETHKLPKILVKKDAKDNADSKSTLLPELDHISPAGSVIQVASSFNKNENPNDILNTNESANNNNNSMNENGLSLLKGTNPKVSNRKKRKNLSKRKIIKKFGSGKTSVLNINHKKFTSLSEKFIASSEDNKPVQEHNLDSESTKMKGQNTIDLETEINSNICEPSHEKKLNKESSKSEKSIDVSKLPCESIELDFNYYIPQPKKRISRVQSSNKKDVKPSLDSNNNSQMASKPTFTDENVKHIETPWNWYHVLLKKKIQQKSSEKYSGSFEKGTNKKECRKRKLKTKALDSELDENVSTENINSNDMDLESDVFNNKGSSKEAFNMFSTVNAKEFNMKEIIHNRSLTPPTCSGADKYAVSASKKPCLNSSITNEPNTFLVKTDVHCSSNIEKDVCKYPVPKLNKMNYVWDFCDENDLNVNVSLDEQNGHPNLNNRYELLSDVALDKEPTNGTSDRFLSSSSENEHPLVIADEATEPGQYYWYCLAGSSEKDTNKKEQRKRKLKTKALDSELDENVSTENINSNDMDLESDVFNNKGSSKEAFNMFSTVNAKEFNMKEIIHNRSLTPPTCSGADKYAVSASKKPCFNSSITNEPNTFLVKTDVHCSSNIEKDVCKYPVPKLNKMNYVWDFCDENDLNVNVSLDEQNGHPNLNNRYELLSDVALDKEPTNGTSDRFLSSSSENEHPLVIADEATEPRQYYWYCLAGSSEKDTNKKEQRKRKLKTKALDSELDGNVSTENINSNDMDLKSGDTADVFNNKGSSKEAFKPLPRKKKSKSKKEKNCGTVIAEEATEPPQEDDKIIYMDLECGDTADVFNNKGSSKEAFKPLPRKKKSKSKKEKNCGTVKYSDKILPKVTPEEIDTGLTINKAFEELEKLKFDESHFELRVHTLVNALINPSNAPDTTSLVFKVCDFLKGSGRNPFSSFSIKNDASMFLPQLEKCLVLSLIQVDHKKRDHLNKLMSSTIHSFYLLVLAKGSIPIYGLCAFCRVLTELCKCIKDKKKPLKLCSDLLKMKHKFAPYLIASIFSVWPEIAAVPDHPTDIELSFLKSIAYGVSKKPKTLNFTQWKHCTLIFSRFLTAPAVVDVTIEILNLMKSIREEPCAEDYMIINPLIIFCGHEDWKWVQERLLDFFIIPSLSHYALQEQNKRAFVLFCDILSEIGLISPDFTKEVELLKDYFFLKDAFDYVKQSTVCSLLKIFLYRGENLPDYLTDYIGNDSNFTEVSILRSLKLQVCRRRMSEKPELTDEDVIPPEIV